MPSPPSTCFRHHLLPPLSIDDERHSPYYGAREYNAVGLPLTGVLSWRKFVRQFAKRGLDPAPLLEGYAALVGIVTPAALPQPVSCDPDDDAVLACAIAADADLIVSGDGDLLSLGSFQRIAILTAAQAVERIKAAT